MKDRNKVNCEDNIPNKHLSNYKFVRHLSKLKDQAISNEIWDVFNQPLQTAITKYRKVRLLVDEQKKLMRDLLFSSTNMAAFSKSHLRSTYFFFGGGGGGF